MRRTIKITAFVLTLIMVLSLTSCGKTDENSIDDNEAVKSIFENTDLSKYVTLGQYKDITVDTSSAEFTPFYKNQLYADIINNNLDKSSVYSTLDSGALAIGDIANIDYVGKKDGVAFDGGTDQGHELTIGSHSFIDGFEDGLIGVNIGDTVDLDLTFPEGYHSAELAGKDVVFTVKINSAKTPDVEKIYGKLGFASIELYNNELNNRAAKVFVSQRAVKNSEITGDLSNHVDMLFNTQCEYQDEQLKSTYNVTLDDALKQQYGITRAEYKEQLKSYLEEEIKNSMVYYSILEKEGIKAEHALQDGEKTGNDILDKMKIVELTVKDFLYDNAKIK